MPNGRRTALGRTVLENFLEAQPLLGKRPALTTPHLLDKLPPRVVPGCSLFRFDLLRFVWHQTGGPLGITSSTSQFARFPLGERAAAAIVYLWQVLPIF